LIACFDWLSNVVQFVKCEVVRSRRPVVNYTHDRRIALRHPLILDGFKVLARSI